MPPRATLRRCGLKCTSNFGHWLAFSIARLNLKFILSLECTFLCLLGVNSSLPEEFGTSSEVQGTEKKCMRSDSCFFIQRWYIYIYIFLNVKKKSKLNFQANIQMFDIMNHKYFFLKSHNYPLSKSEKIFYLRIWNSKRLQNR